MDGWMNRRIERGKRVRQWCKSIGEPDERVKATHPTLNSITKGRGHKHALHQCTIAFCFLPFFSFGLLASALACGPRGGRTPLDLRQISENIYIYIAYLVLKLQAGLIGARCPVQSIFRPIQSRIQPPRQPHCKHENKPGLVSSLIHMVLMGVGCSRCACRKSKTNKQKRCDSTCCCLCTHLSVILLFFSSSFFFFPPPSLFLCASRQVAEGSELAVDCLGFPIRT